MIRVKAVVFDFIGTLTNVSGYSLEASKTKLYEAIRRAGFSMPVEDFVQAYEKAHEKYRIVRYDQLVEVTNAVWIHEALELLGFDTKPDDSRIKTAVNIFFEDYLESLELRPRANPLLVRASADFKLGLASNFTYAPVIYAGLRKLGISRFFSAILVSEAFGWRKPHANVFAEILKRLEVKSDEAIYVGDSPLEDIKGAEEVGMQTVFVQSQFYTMESLKESGQKPDFVVKDLEDLYRRYESIFFHE